MKRHFQDKTTVAAKKKGRGGSSGGANPRNDGRITETQHDEAMRVLRAEYYQAVRGLAQEAIERAKTGEDMNDALHELIDGSYGVIYTHANFQVLMCSDHHDAYSENFGEPPVSGSDINWAALAYAAMEQDVQEQIQAEGGVEEVEEAPQHFDKALEKYARLTAADMNSSLKEAIQAMRDEPGEVARELKLSKDYVVRWCESQLRRERPSFTVRSNSARR